MPTASDILANLSLIANNAIAVAVAWHLASAITIFALITTWHPSNRAAAVLLSLPLASVSIAAWIFANRFNGIVFGVAALGLALLAARGNTNPVAVRNRASLAAASALFLYAWGYPHFLDEHPLAVYLYAAPLGVLPCPTLALVVAAALAGDGIVRGVWQLALSSLAMFYALFGIVRLGVTLDLGLLLGAIALLAQHWTKTRSVKLRTAA